MRKRILTAMLMLGVPAAAQAQDAPPFTEDLFLGTWVVKEFEGNENPDFRPIITFDGQTASGDTGCYTFWKSKVTLSLPSVRFSDVNGDLKGCDEPAAATRFLDALRKVHKAEAGEDGLALIGPDGQRVAVLVAGG